MTSFLTLHHHRKIVSTEHLNITVLCGKTNKVFLYVPPFNTARNSSSPRQTLSEDGSLHILVQAVLLKFLDTKQSYACGARNILLASPGNVLLLQSSLNRDVKKKLHRNALFHIMHLKALRRLSTGIYPFFLLCRRNAYDNSCLHVCLF